MELKTARRSGGRSRKSARQSKKSIDQLEWGIPYNTDNFVEPLSEEGVNKVHNATMQVLEEIGIEFLNEEAKKVLSEAGCKVDRNSDNVKMDRSWVKEMISKAPSEFEIFPRNINRSVKIGGSNTVFAPVYGPPFVRALDGVRRYAKIEDFKKSIFSGKK